MTMPKIPESRLYHLLIALAQRHGLGSLAVETHHDGINSWGDEYSYTTVDSVLLRDFVVFELGLRHDGDESLYVDVQTLQHAKADVDKFLCLLVNLLDYQDYDSAARTYVYTEAQYEQLERDRERRKAEVLARDFAARHGVEPGTEAFLDALDAEVERLTDAREAWDDSEARFERGCRAVATLGSARGADVYFDDQAFEAGRFRSALDDLEQIYSFLHRYCPLLMAMREERKLQQS
jgi:hypothetical protein